MSSQPKTFLTPEEYLEIERAADHKSEYYEGEMFAMAGGSLRHAWIIMNIGGELRQQLKGRPYFITASDLRLRVSPTGLYTYPDVVVVCGEPQYAGDQKDTLLNPSVIIEVLSDSTRDYDLGRKCQHYRTLSSLRDYLMVAQDKPHIDHWMRQEENRGILTEYNDLSQSITLPSIECVLALSEVYDKVDWSTA
jgi:Uma2 family endonuclease